VTRVLIRHSYHSYYVDSIAAATTGGSRWKEEGLSMLWRLTQLISAWPQRCILLPSSHCLT